jgi:hypothetical protein
MQGQSIHRNSWPGVAANLPQIASYSKVARAIAAQRRKA